jgi:predicted DNA-binding protein
MSIAKKAKSDDRVVLYVRVPLEVRDRITKIASKRGYPHTIASVTSEIISKGLPQVEVLRDKA